MTDTSPRGATPAPDEWGEASGDGGDALPSLAAVRRVAVGSANPVKVAAGRAGLAPQKTPRATQKNRALTPGGPAPPGAGKVPNGSVADDEIAQCEI